MKLYDNITQVVGNTPLVKINRILDGAKAQVYAKLEFYNPSSTVKDRIGIAMIDDAEKIWQIKTRWHNCGSYLGKYRCGISHGWRSSRLQSYFDNARFSK